METCLAITSLAETFLFDEVFELLSEVATEAHSPPPSVSAIRKDLDRLRDTFSAIERLPFTKGERLRREVRRSSSLWALCDELALRP